MEESQSLFHKILLIVIHQGDEELIQRARSAKNAFEAEYRSPEQVETIKWNLQLECDISTDKVWKPFKMRPQEHMKGYFLCSIH